LFFKNSTPDTPNWCDSQTKNPWHCKAFQVNESTDKKMEIDWEIAA
jgi:hypothetical protein